MITRAEAQQITVSSYNDLCNRHGGTVRGNDTISDIVNVGCHYLLSHYKDIVQTADKDEVYDLVPLNYKYMAEAKIIAGAMKQWLPDLLPQQHIDGIASMIILNIGWSGMWNFLCDYFKQEHDRVI